MSMMVPLLELLNSRLQQTGPLPDEYPWEPPSQTSQRKPQMGKAALQPAPAPRMRKGAGATQSRPKQVPRPTGHETTLMIRNIPNRAKSTRLLEKMDEAGFAGAYDYVYIPLDPQSWVNKGYAFVNFTEPAAARAFASIVEGIPMESSTRSAKKMTASPAKLQGMHANLQAISNGYSAEEASWPFVRIGGILEEMQPARALKLLSTSWPA
jgi:hypothetical protein